MSLHLEIVVGRIEMLQRDAIVNAANSALWPGGGVDGSIRAAAGPAMNARLAQEPNLPEGAALITPGYDLPARFVIHTVAPVWFAPGPTEPEKIAGLQACYRQCVAAARGLGIASVAFPALGAGAFGWPRPLACATAINTVRAAGAGWAALVTFCCFTEEDAALYRATLREPHDG